MRLVDFAELIFFIAVLFASAKPLAIYLERVFGGNRTFLSPLLSGIENLIYRLAGIDPEEDQSWRRYANVMVLFSAVTCFLTYLLLRLQGRLPLNPQKFPAIL